MNTLQTERRDLAIKAKRLRREGFVTGNLFGHKIEGSIPLKIRRSALDALLKTHGVGSRLILDVEGETHNVLIKEIQFNTFKGQVDEIDFQDLVSGEMVRSFAEIEIKNHDKVREGILQQNLEEISYSALPGDLVEKVEVDVEGLKPGQTIKVGDLDMAKNPKIHLHVSPEAVIVAVTTAKSAPAAVETAEEAEAAPAAE